MRRMSLVLVGLVVASAAVFAQVPTSADQVPVYPGAKLVSEQQGPTKEEIASGKAVTWMFGLDRVTTSTASVEQVAQFYAGRFGAAVEQEGGADANELDPGQISSVGSSVDYWDQGLIDESPDSVQAGFQKRARLPGAEAWASGAAFSWAYKNAEKDPYSFTLTITDKSVSDEEPSRYAQLTEIRLSVRMMNREKMAAQQAEMQRRAQASATMTPEQYQAAQKAWAEETLKRERAFEAENARMKAEADKIRAEMARTPTEKELGVAIYPGARYQVELSQDRTSYLQGRGRMYVFEVAAGVDAVVQFYVKRTGNKIATKQDNLTIIPINFGKPAQKGDAPPMKDSVTVGGPTDTGTAVIMILKWPADETGQGAAGR